MAWTEQNITAMQALWSAYFSPAAIAAILEMTPDAVSGKVERLLNSDNDAMQRAQFMRECNQMLHDDGAYTIAMVRRLIDDARMRSHFAELARVEPEVLQARIDSAMPVSLWS